MTAPLPRQMSDEALIVDIAGAAKAGLVFLMGSSFLIHPIFQMIINKIFNLISPLKNISHFVLHKMNYPANIADFFGQLFPLIIFDIIPEDILSFVYRLDKAPDAPFQP